MKQRTITTLPHFCKTLKNPNKIKKQDPTQPVSCWAEKDVLEGKVVDAFVIIFRTQGCSWALKSGCTMCGYSNDSMFTKVAEKDLQNQFNVAMQKFKEEKIVKIFNSGSFFDTCEITAKTRNTILKNLSEKTEKIIVESRPEYITNTTLAEAKKTIKNTKFEVGIGLETANDYLRKHAINKGFTFTSYKKAATLAKKNDCKVKTYILIKPPFITEQQAIKDSINTAANIKQYTHTISFNPMNIQRNTLVEYLWRRKYYRPPWLWSVIEILKESKKIVGANIHIKCDISGGGNIRGAHNCKVCDKDFLKKISEFSLNQDTKILNDFKCSCKEHWLDQLNLEQISIGSLNNLSAGM